MTALWLGAGDEGDLDALVELERACFSHPWTRAQLRTTLRSDADVVLVLRDPEMAVVAYAVIVVVAGELQIHNVAVQPAHRGRGLGRWLVELVLDIGRRRGAQDAYLEVRQSNVAAQALYRRLGFTDAGVRRRYYSEPAEDALLMTLRLDSGAPRAGD